MIANKDSLKLAYSLKVEGIIWKIILDEAQDIMVWECRKADKSITFYAYDFINKQLLLDAYAFPPDWQLNIHTVHQGILYFTGLESEFSPVQKGIVAMDLSTKATVWQNFSVGLQAFTNEGIIAYDARLLPRKFVLLNAQTGVLLQNIETKDINNFTYLGNDILLPKMLQGSAILDTRYVLNYHNLTITSSFEPNNNAYKQLIEVQKNGQLLLQEIMNSEIQKLSFDTFFVWHNRLVYLKNKSEIVTYFV
ncbi:DUF4905 domain-containing protein [Pelobium manganitolerans]|uniref:DUF4905 domain-containing protein n=1 Tax=Pelobium manganitolerans TaxID=1842495 RepID=UPI003FA3448F